MGRFSELDIERRQGGGAPGLEQSAPVRRVLEGLEAVTRSGGGFKARCPAHDDHNPSLSVRQGKDGRAFVKCFAGCEKEDILKALELEAEDLLPENTNEGPDTKKRLKKEEADQQLADRGITQEAREEFGITTDVRRQAWRIPIADGAKLKRFASKGEGDKYRWDGKKRAGTDLFGADKLTPGGEHVWLLEGELDVVIAWQADVPAVSFTGGAGYVPEGGVRALVDRGVTSVRICYDRDDAGRRGAQLAAAALGEAGLAVDIRVLPDSMVAGSDVMDLYNEVGRDAAKFTAALEGLESVPMVAVGEGFDTISLEDFWAYLPDHKYIFRPTGALWPGASVNALFGKVWDAEEEISASLWLDRHRSVEQMTWAPGGPQIIADQLLLEGGWVKRSGVTCFNLYQPPNMELGDPAGAGRWLDHVHLLFPAEADHLIAWLAHRVQRPGDKVNHALLLGGRQGGGKDTLIEGAVRAIGTWNVHDVTPEDMFSEFNPHAKSVVLRVSEARDLGERDRYRFYEHLKTYIAAPPMVLRVNEKHIRQYQIPNVCGVVLTTNHSDGVYLSPDDRRFFIAWTEKSKDDFAADYWDQMYKWYEQEGYRNIAAYLAQHPLGGFNPKAPPPKTAAFWTMVDAGRSPEDAELADAIDRLDKPDAITIQMVIDHVNQLFRADAGADLAEWLEDRRNRRQIRHRMEDVGYVHVPSETAGDGRWKVGGRRVVIYGRADITPQRRYAAASRLVREGRA